MIDIRQDILELIVAAAAVPGFCPITEEVPRDQEPIGFAPLHLRGVIALRERLRAEAEIVFEEAEGPEICEMVSQRLEAIDNLIQCCLWERFSDKIPENATGFIVCKDWVLIPEIAYTESSETDDPLDALEETGSAIRLVHNIDA